ncbi:20783_t:CDS:2, partial [Gigaspora rosea]
RDRPQAEKDILNLGLVEEAGLRKKLRMDLDSVDRVAASGDVEANNTGETGPVNNNTQRGDGRESASSDIEPRNNSLQGEGKLEANEGSFESQVQIMHELIQNVEPDNNSLNQSNYSKETPVRENSTETTHKWSGLFTGTKLRRGRATFSNQTQNGPFKTKNENAVIFDIRALNNFLTNEIVIALYNKIGDDMLTCIMTP